MQFLTDLTGNRRWLPFEISSIDNPYTHPVDYEGVYSQAYALWKGGMRYWFEDEEIKLVNLHNRNFEVPSMERELIQAYYRHPLPGEKGTFVSIHRYSEPHKLCREALPQPRKDRACDEAGGLRTDEAERKAGLPRGGAVEKLKDCTAVLKSYTVWLKGYVTMLKVYTVVP